jgi:hypothetical protein
MKNPIQKVPELFARFSRAAWPILTGRPETLPETKRKADQVAANQEWEDEGGAIKQPAANDQPKLPL